MTATFDLTLDNARLADGRLVSIEISGGRIVAIRSAGDPVQRGQELDLSGQLVLPGLTDGHVHLDKTLLALPWRPHRSAPSIRARIDDEKAHRRANPASLVERGAEKLLETALRLGTTSLRTHVDIDEVSKLDTLKEVLELRARWADRVQIQIVAFPQSGVVTCPVAAEYLEEALRMGADFIGGLDPLGIDGDQKGQLDVIFGLAERYGRGLDIHLHDGGETGLAEIDDIAARTRAAGLEGRTTISHAFALADAAPARLEATATALREAKVSILSSIPGGDRCPPIPKLRELGVDVFFGSDNIRDCWNPSSVIGMIDRMMLATYRFGLRRDEDIAALLDHATTIPARVAGLGDGEIKVGARADLIAFEALHLPQVVVERQIPSMVIADGTIVHG
ncbi:amidohydrolase [Bosea rubneri]|uniref:Amidohydrolase n=1 Tax=Bosea rubneri TaxID=3075434 RepID=A0ABU3S907_9HYPH|nr:amidohydrolase [Bosea sp. ZW T0_25]MDU0341266.1 amidohydrolase [Bosea sp. ZW T0_25]